MDNDRSSLDNDSPSLDKERPSLGNDRPSLDQVKNLHEMGQVVSYKTEKHRIRLDFLRPETWYH